MREMGCAVGEILSSHVTKQCPRAILLVRDFVVPSTPRQGTVQLPDPGSPAHPEPWMPLWPGQHNQTAGGF